MVPLRCLSLDVGFGTFFDSTTKFGSSRTGTVGRNQVVVGEEETQTKIALPQGDIVEAPLFESCEVPVGSLVVPLCAASILLHDGGVLQDRGHDLSGTATIPNDGHTFTAVVVVMVPPGCMEDLALEFVHARKFGVSWQRYATDG